MSNSALSSIYTELRRDNLTQKELMYNIKKFARLLRSEKYKLRELFSDTDVMTELFDKAPGLHFDYDWYTRNHSLLSDFIELCGVEGEPLEYSPVSLMKRNKLSNDTFYFSGDYYIIIEKKYSSPELLEKKPVFKDTRYRVFYVNLYPNGVEYNSIVYDTETETTYFCEYDRIKNKNLYSKCDIIHVFKDGITAKKYLLFN